MEHYALVELVCQGPDEAAAAAVTAFEGDINACCPEKATALIVAVACGRSLTIAALAARGDCNPNSVTLFGEPVLCYVAGPRTNGPDMATFLAQFPTVDVNACDPGGYTPLHCAALWSHETNVRLLLDAGADPTIRSREGLTPAELAHKHGFTHCTKLLEAAAAWHSGLRREWMRSVVVLEIQ